MNTGIMFTNGNSRNLIPLRSSNTFATRTTGTLAKVSQVDLQLAIETEQIVDILNQTIKKIELAMCLPLLIEGEAAFLHSCLTRDEFALVTKSCAPYTKKLSIKVREDCKLTGPLTLSGNKFNKSLPSVIAFEEGEDVNMYTAMKMLYSKQVVMDKVKQLLPQVSPSAGAFIRYLKRLQTFGKEHLSMSPLQQLEKQKDLYRIWNDNKTAKQEISKIVKYLEEQNNELQLKMMAKNLMINQHEGKIERLNKKCKEDIKKRVCESERRMILDCEESEMQHHYLDSEIQYHDERMKSLLKANLGEEESLRDKKHSVKMQLVHWLNKYDKDIGTKQKEYDEILAGFNEEKQQMKDLKLKFAVQESEYKRQMKEKTDGEKAILERKLLAFIYTRSARRIQRYWRAYRTRKLSRRKGRKKKKGTGSGKMK